MTGFFALYVVLLAAITGYQIVSRVTAQLHTPLLFATNCVLAVVLVGAVVLLGHADSTLERVGGFLGVFLATAGGVGGFLATRRLLDALKPGGGAR